MSPTLISAATTAAAAAAAITTTTTTSTSTNNNNTLRYEVTKWNSGQVPIGHTFFECFHHNIT